MGRGKAKKSLDLIDAAIASAALRGFLRGIDGAAEMAGSAVLAGQPDARRVYHAVLEREIARFCIAYVEADDRETIAEALHAYGCAWLATAREGGHA